MKSGPLNIDQLQYNELEEFMRLFINMYEIPEENTIEKCLLIIIGKKQGIAIGLSVVYGSNVIKFKSTKIDDVKSICKKYKIKTIYDNKYASLLTYYGYINEVIPKEMKIWEYTVYKYLQIMKKDKLFKKN